MQAKEKLALSGSVMHLLHRAGQIADEFFTEEMQDTDLTPRQYAVLVVLSGRDAASQTDIVDATGIDRSTLADIVKRLADRGYLARRRSKADARAYSVRLTPSGLAALKQAQPAAERAAERVIRPLSAARRQELLGALDSIVTAAAAAQRAPAARPRR
jgi:DNA-binding MarR family transcriptional regulator